MTFKLSPSSLGLMQECPRCFWLEKHKIWHRPAGIFPSLPSGMDLILKKHFDKFRDRGELPPELAEHKECAGMQLFEDAELLNVWRNNLKGIRWEDAEGNILMGAVDNILVKGNKLIVLDYKTRGFPLKEDTTKIYQSQLDIYNLLLLKNRYVTEEYAFLLFYYPNEVLETGEVIFDTELVKMKVDVRRAEYMFKDALKLLNAEYPEKTCVWCEGR